MSVSSTRSPRLSAAIVPLTERFSNPGGGGSNFSMSSFQSRSMSSLLNSTFGSGWRSSNVLFHSPNGAIGPKSFYSLMGRGVPFRSRRLQVSETSLPSYATKWDATSIMVHQQIEQVAVDSCRLWFPYSHMVRRTSLGARCLQRRARSSDDRIGRRNRRASPRQRQSLRASNSERN